MSRLALRSYYWGALVVVVAAGELSAETADVLEEYLDKLQGENDIVVDLWDATHCNAEGVATLEAAKQRSEEAGWGFAVVADPDGPCAAALAAGGPTKIRMFADRHAARAALAQL